MWVSSAGELKFFLNIFKPFYCQKRLFYVAAAYLCL